MLSLKDVARKYGVHYQTVWRLARCGKLPGAVKVGGCWRVNPDKLKEKWG